MSFDYENQSKLISKTQLDEITQYYSGWKGHFDINLKFRFLKAFVYDLTNDSPKWLLLHRWANKRRISNHILPNIINSMIKDGLIPIRLFHSVSEWLSPHEIDRNKYPWIIKSSILPIETDLSLEDSLETAKQVGKLIEGQRFYVYSGNKSVHVWWLDFDYNQYLKSSEISEINSAKTREKYDRLARKRFLQHLQRVIPSELDERNAIDTKRVVPIIDTLNGFTMRKVLRIHENSLNQLSVSQILNQSML